jgi:hypothetical protein
MPSFESPMRKYDSPDLATSKRARERLKAPCRRLSHRKTSGSGDRAERHARPRHICKTLNRLALHVAYWAPFFGHLYPARHPSWALVRVRRQQSILGQHAVVTVCTCTAMQSGTTRARTCVARASCESCVRGAAAA